MAKPSSPQKKPSPAPKPPTQAELMSLRLQKIINNPTAQKACAAVIHKLPGESEELWEDMITSIGDTDGVHVTFQDDGGVKIFWDKPKKE